MHKEPVTLEDVECKATTSLALLLYIPDLDEEVWIPRSQIIDEDSDDLDVGETGMVVVTAWIAKQKGIT